MKRAFLYIALALAVVIIGLVAIQIAFSPNLAGWRDIFLIIMGVLALLWLILMIGVAVALLAVIALLRSKLPELLNKASSTAETVKGTTGFVGERVVSPFIKVSAAAAGARAAVRTLMGGDDDKK